jgi:hypothetical protein
MIKFQNILLEGKKENLIDKYKDSPAFSDAPELLEKLIDGDPSATKKYSEWMIKQMISLGDPITFSVADNVNLFIDLIESFHKSATAIKPEDIDYAASTSSFVDASKIKSSPKDINKYKSIWGLQAVLNGVRQRQIMVQKEKEVKNESNKIYEDDKYLIVEPYSHGASCYYGAGTKWCTTTKGDTRYFDKYSDEGSLYYIIDKKSNDGTWGKMALFVRSNGNTEVYDQKDSVRSLDVLLQRFEPIADKIKSLVKGQNHYETLSKIMNGEVDHQRGKIHSEILQKIEKNGDNDYTVVLNFHGPEDFLDLFEGEVEESDLKFVEYAIDQPYGRDVDYYDPYNFDDDLSDGYYLYNLSDDELETLKEILQIFDPEVAKLIKGSEKGYQIDNDDYSTIGKYMSENFDSSFIDEIRDAYTYAKNRAVEVGLQKEFTEGLCNIYESMGLEKQDECFFRYNVSLKDILNLYESNEYYRDLNLKGMLKDYVSTHISFPFDYPYEYTYQVEDDQVFTDEFNTPTERAFERYYDDLKDSDFFVDVDEYIRLNDVIKKEFTVGFNIPVPSQEGVNINIEGVDPETNKIKFTLKRFNNETDSFETKKGRAKLSSLRSLMNNYQLFDPFE